MFFRNINDHTGLEPAKLYNMVQFMLYDVDNNVNVSVDETMNMLYARRARSVPYQNAVSRSSFTKFPYDTKKKCSYSHEGGVSYGVFLRYLLVFLQRICRPCRRLGEKVLVARWSERILN